jgi:hypothetical protein
MALFARWFLPSIRHRARADYAHALPTRRLLFRRVAQIGRGRVKRNSEPDELRKGSITGQATIWCSGWRPGWPRPSPPRDPVVGRW